MQLFELPNLSLSTKNIDTICDVWSENWPSDINGQCSSRSACASIQSDLRATLSADKSLFPYLYAPDRLDRGPYCFCPVCLWVCLFVINFNLAYDFWTITGADLILGMHIHHMRAHISIGDLTRSRSSFKVKVQFKGQFCVFEDCP